MYSNQRGFSVLAVLIFIASIVSVIGIWIFSGNSNVQSGKNYDVLAASFIADGENIKAQYEKLVLEYNAPNKITFLPNTASTTSLYNILDPVNGISYPHVSQALIRSAPTASNGFWLYNANQFLGNVGTTASDPTVLVAGINDEACKSINYILSGKRILLSAGMSNYNPSDANPTKPTSNTFVNLSFLAAYKNVYSGCVSTASTTNNNFYFRILKAN